MQAELDLRKQPGPHVFVEDLEIPALDDDDRHHLVKSLRLRDGDPLTVSDGRGRWRCVTLGAALRSTGPIVEVQPPPYAVGLAIALAKSSKPELVVQKATELGVDEVVIFEARRSVARWDDAKQVKGIQRLARVAREAAMQSRQVRIPTVRYVIDLASIANASSVVRADFGGEPVDAAHRQIAIGPEGGWAPREVEQVPQTVDLGPTVLRAETAALAAAMQMVVCRQG